MIPKRKIKKILTGSYELPNNVRQAIPSPVVQVQTITYQHAPYIRDCIEGVLMQKTNFPFEYLIGEDCSTDGTREIVFEYAKKHPEKIRVITADKNFGMMGNIRRCRMAARGKYIALCEGDDYWTDPYKLQKHVDFMQKNPGVSITYHDAMKVDADKNIIEQSMLPEIRKRNFSSDELKTGIWILTYTMCFRNLIDKYPENYFRVYNGDTFLTSLLGNYGSGVYLGNISPSCYRINESGVFSMKTDVQKRILSISTITELMNFYKQKNDIVYYNYFVTRIQKTLLDLLEYDLTGKNKKMLSSYIIKNAPHIGIKNSLYYLKKLL